MQLHDLKPAPGAHRRPDRVGRGTGSGRGKTAGRGEKGQNKRSEGFRLGFEGGQMPFSQRIPKLPGFKNRFKKFYAVVNVSKLSRFPDGTKIDGQALLEAGLVRGGKEIKILGTGRLKRKLTVEAHAFSNSAREAIEKAGGSVTVIGGETPSPRRGEGPGAIKGQSARERAVLNAPSAQGSEEPAPAE